MASLDFKSIVRKLREQGWEIVRTSNGHYRAKPPNPEMSIVHFSESDEPRAVRNTISDLRKSGFVWEETENQRTDTFRRVLAETRAARAAKDLFDVGVEVVEAMVEAESTPPPASTSAPPPASIDDLYQAMKDAKQYAALAEEHLREMDEAFKRARAAFDQAEKERDGSLLQLAAARARFLEAFDREEEKKAS